MSPALLRSLSARLDRLAERVGNFSAWLALLLVLLTFAVVMLRYLFNVGWIAMQEATLYLHASLFLLGAAYTLLFLLSGVAVWGARQVPRMSAPARVQGPAQGGAFELLRQPGMARLLLANWPSRTWPEEPSRSQTEGFLDR